MRNKDKINELLELGKRHLESCTTLSKCNLVKMAIEDTGASPEKYLPKVGLDNSLSVEQAINVLGDKIRVLTFDSNVYFKEAEKLFLSLDNMEGKDKVEVNRIWSSIKRNNINIIKLR